MCLDGGGSLYASPALSNDNSRVYIACYNAGMFGLNRQTGKIDWTTPLKNVMSSPAVVRPPPPPPPRPLLAVMLGGCRPTLTLLSLVCRRGLLQSDLRGMGMCLGRCVLCSLCLRQSVGGGGHTLVSFQVRNRVEKGM